MKAKKKLIPVLFVIAILIIGVLIWWNIPSTIISISPSEVSKIEIFDGNTGKAMTITGVADIEHVITNLNEVILKKDKVSLGYIGYSFKTTIYKMDDTVYKKFIINSNDTIRKDPFFYWDSSKSIDYDYIRGLINDNEK